MNLKAALFPTHIYVSFSLNFTYIISIFLPLCQYCSNENSCVCFVGFTGYDCSQVLPTIQPPPMRRTAYPPDNTPPSADKSHSTPTNTYIRKSFFPIPPSHKTAQSKSTRCTVPHLIPRRVQACCSGNGTSGTPSCIMEWCRTFPYYNSVCLMSFRRCKRG